MSNSKKVLFSLGKFTILKCLECDQVYVDSIDLEAITVEYDTRSYFDERNEYLSKWDTISASFQKIVDTIKSHKATGTFLDVGCSVGILLDVARKNGFNVKGVEVSAWASQFAREKGFDVVTGYLADAGYSEHLFDVVTLNHVLEHIPDPADVMQEVRRIMKDDALLVVGVPNFGSLAARFKRESWASLMPDQHIWQFTRHTLNNFLRTQGFEVIHFEARDCHEIVGWRPGKILMRLLNLVAVATNNGDAMLVIARKA